MKRIESYTSGDTPHVHNMRPSFINGSQNQALFSYRHGIPNTCQVVHDLVDLSEPRNIQGFSGWPHRHLIPAEHDNLCKTEREIKHPAISFDLVDLSERPEVPVLIDFSGNQEIMSLSTPTPTFYAPDKPVISNSTPVANPSSYGNLSDGTLDLSVGTSFTNSLRLKREEGEEKGTIPKILSPATEQGPSPLEMSQNPKDEAFNSTVITSTEFQHSKKVKPKKKNFYKRAQQYALKIKDDPKRITGLMASHSSNSKFVDAVTKELRKLQIDPKNKSLQQIKVLNHDLQKATVHLSNHLR